VGHIAGVDVSWRAFVMFARDGVEVHELGDGIIVDGIVFGR